jgi:hypothetical protein
MSDAIYVDAMSFINFLFLAMICWKLEKIHDDIKKPKQ